MTSSQSITIGRGTHNGMPRRFRTSGNRPAFTLIEVLATLLLPGIVLPVAMRGVSLAMAAADKARHTSEASSLAQGKLNDLVTNGLSTAAGSGDFGAEHPGFRWTSQVVARDYNVSEIDLNVTWIERGTNRSLVVSTLFYDTSGVQQ